MRGALVLVVVAGCSYDWSVAAEPTSDPVGMAPDGGEGGVDAAGERDASEPDAVAPDAGRVCADVLADLAQARRDAKACPTLTAPCEREIQDECGCRSFLWQANTGAVSRYEALITESASLGCVASGCNCVTGSSGTCLAAGAGVYACTP